MMQPIHLLLLASVGSLLSVVTPFRRDNVEFRPPPVVPTSNSQVDEVAAGLPTLQRYSIAQRLGAKPRFGSTALPLRQAVERVPSPTDRAEEHYPIRDAVEQRPVLPSKPLGQWWNHHRMAYLASSAQVQSNPPQRAAPLADKAVYCFVESWAAYRRAPMSFSADHVDPHLCTHLIYAFARVDSRTHKLAPVDEEYDIVKGGYRSVVFLKRLNPRLKVLLSVAGPFGAAMTSSLNRRTFILSAVRLLHEYNFDGLDLHWQLPELEGTTTPSDTVSPHQSTQDTPPDTLSRLLEEMSGVFEARAWTLTLSVSASRFRAEDAYPPDIQLLSSYVTHVLLKSYDLHEERGGGGGGGVAVHHAPLQAPPPTQDALALFFNVDYAVRYWLKRGVPRHKLIMGIPLYARTYTLQDASRWQPGSAVLSGGAESRYTQQPGLLAYYEVCEKLVTGDDVITKDTSDDVREPWRLFRDQGNAPFMVRGDQWVGYEDPLSIQTKMRYVNQQKLGGVMVWALDLDDFQGRYCGRKYPLLNAVNDHLHAYDWPLAVHQPPLAPPTSALAPPTLALAPPTALQGSPSNLELEWSRKAASGCSKGQFTAHPTNCNQYLQCQWGAYQIYSCPAGLHWNSKNNICDWPSRATCLLTSTSNSGGGGGSSKPVSMATTSTTTLKPWEWQPESTTEWSWTSPATSPKPIRNKPSKPSGKHPLSSGQFKVVCYFTNWAWYRTGTAKYLPEDIDTNLCTHVLYGFAVLDFENLIIKAHDSWADFDNKFYERVVAMKKKGVHVLLAIGGWNDSQGDKYSRLVNSAAARQRFVKHVVPFLLKYDFDGLDLDWEYPKCWQVNCDKGPASDKESFGLFVKELKTAFRAHDLLLSAAVSPSKAVIDEGYDVKTMAANLDWISVMTYDYHGQWDKKTGHLAPMYHHPEDDFDYFNANYSISYWLSEGVPKRKLVMGMPLYGQSFTLAKREVHGLNAAAPGPGRAGESTRAAGFLAYYEICSRIKDGSWTVVQDEGQRMGPYAYKGDQWISFDDKDTIRRKSEWIREMGLGGGMVWALDLDDFRNTCGGGKHPLLSIIAKTLAKPSSAGGVTTTTITTTTTTPEPEPTTLETSATTSPIHSPTTLAVAEPEKPTEPAPTSSTTTEDVEEVEATTDDELEEETTTTSTTTTTTKRPRPVKPPAKPSKPKPKPPKPKPTTSTTTERPGQDHFKVVCYFTNWAWYRQGEGKYLPSDIDPELCTHIIYGFAVLDSDHLTIKPHDTWADFDNKFYEKVIAVKKKKKQRNIRVLIAIGGWNDSAGDKYSRLVNSVAARQRFVQHVLQFIQEHGFDGLDLDWEYPKCWQVNCQQGPDSDKESFAAFVKELHEAFKPHGLLLSAAVSPSRTVITAGYDVKALSKYLDWISVMAYDYHGQWDKVTGHVAPMYAHPEDDDVTFNTNFTMHYWMRQGADRRKLVVGMPMYGQSFSLASTDDNGLNAPTYGGGEAGEQTRARGFLAYYEICQRTLKQGWEVVRDEEGRIGPYARLRDQWVSFDDQSMIAYKSNYVKANNFGGAMIWALDLDDFRNLCGCGEYPLLKTINRVLRNYPGPQPECRLTQAQDGDNAESAITEFPERNNEVEGEVDAGTDPELQPACVNGVMAHPGDCSRYYSCWNNGQSRTQLSCPPGLHFDSVRNVCEWPDKAVCWPNSNVLAPADVASRLQQQQQQQVEEEQQTGLAFQGTGPASYFAGKFPWSSLQQGIPVWFARI